MDLKFIGVKLQLDFIARWSLAGPQTFGLDLLDSLRSMLVTTYLRSDYRSNYETEQAPHRTHITVANDIVEAELNVNLLHSLFSVQP